MRVVSDILDRIRAVLAKGQVNPVALTGITADLATAVEELNDGIGTSVPLAPTIKAPSGASVGGLVNANVVTYNAGVPGWVSTLVGEGYNVVTCPINTGFVPATMTLADNIHLNLSGCQHCGNIIADQLVSLGFYLPTNQYCMSGHSEVEGGLTLIPRATAQIRNWTAYYLVNQ